MYDSDESGFFALGILMVFGTVAILQYILDNLIWFIAAFILFGVLAYMWIKYGDDIITKIEKWYIAKAKTFLHSFGIELYNKKVWRVFCILEWLLINALRFCFLLGGIWIFGFILDKI